MLISQPRFSANNGDIGISVHSDPRNTDSHIGSKHLACPAPQRIVKFACNVSLQPGMGERSARHRKHLPVDELAAALRRALDRKVLLFRQLRNRVRRHWHLLAV